MLATALPVILLGNFAYMISAIAFAVRDILWLRLLAIGSSSLLITSNVLGTSDTWYLPTFWHSVFIVVHFTRVMIILYGDRTARFTAEEAELHQTLFRNFTRLEFLKLLRAGHWEKCDPGSVLATQDQPLDQLLLISHGQATVRRDEQVLATLRDGQFIGEMSYSTGQPASATVTADETLKILQWRQADLRSLFQRNPSLRHGFESILCTDLSHKLHPHARSVPPVPPHTTA